ncbi:MAG TPA: hypothetical protein DDY13_13525 [Cytophagales bacterium]|jgi:uncharacterized tellurite resistance protein B-like protein|nr:hypothetical protein [Cytophagales bacterium]
MYKITQVSTFKFINMTTSANRRSGYKKGLIALYYLLIHADGKISDREVQMGTLMQKAEDIEIDFFEEIMKQSENIDNETLLKNSIVLLNTCSYEQKVRSIAWLSVIANSDGFMDREEWSLIYRIYNNELKVSLDDILECQKLLPKIYDMEDNNYYQYIASE